MATKQIGTGAKGHAVEIRFQPYTRFTVFGVLVDNVWLPADSASYREFLTMQAARAFCAERYGVEIWQTYPDEGARE